MIYNYQTEQKSSRDGAEKESLGGGAWEGSCSEDPTAPTSDHCERFLGPQEAKIASQPSCLQRGSGRVEAAQVQGCWGGGESLSTCEMAHWAAAMAVLATEAALMRLPSLEAMSLGRMSETGSETGGPKLGGQLGKDTGGALTS